MPLLHVIRHGQTDHNLEGRYQGRLDVPLNENGRRQAEEGAARIVMLGITAVLCSDLRRAIETAETVARRTGARLICDERLAERSLGEYEGLTREQAADRYPELYAAVVTRRFDGAPPGGETPRRVCERISAALDDLLPRLAGEDACLVTHGFVAKAIDAHFRGDADPKRFFEFSLKNCETVSYRYETGAKGRSEK